MTLNRYAKRRDSAEPPIVDALRKAGAYVCQVSQEGLPDLFVQFRSRWFALEVKSGQRRSQTRQLSQRRFLTLTGTPIVRTPDAALKAIGAIVPDPRPLALTPSPSRPGEQP